MEAAAEGLDKALLQEEKTISPEQRELVRRCLNAIEDRAQKIQQKGMTKCNFVFGVSNTLFVAWSFGALPGYFWIVYLAEAILLLPIRWFRMIRRTPKEHLYWLDFCWCANFAGVLFLLALLVGDQPLLLQKWSFCAAWGLGNGPLLCATAVLGNSLLFHDFENASSVVIHLLPALVTYSMGWNRDALLEAFPQIFTYQIWDEIRPWEDIFANAAEAYLFWWFLYAAWLLSIGVNSPRCGYDTIFHHTMTGAGGIVTRKILRVTSEEHKRLVKDRSFPRSYAVVYLVIHATLVLGSIPVSLLCFLDRRMHVCLCAAMLLVTIYNASSRYTYYMVTSYGEALRRELQIPAKRGASAIGFE
ncbi:unnamed protein product [Effrenium voratum]|uniref:Glycerophosphocholine acyltransferase 1 n=1 Tax=Effrenium voratum TaxID=2562239 RepID=A0AA36MI26_9DINO|nr:unnamed protein product [Effrenium voratum]